MEEGTSLDRLMPGSRGLVEEISAQGAMRRRLQDLGFVAGAQVECLGKSPLGDPRAYGVRGAVVALRRRDARLVEIRPL
jgi:ferrous iron transport protein A